MPVFSIFQSTLDLTPFEWCPLSMAAPTVIDYLKQLQEQGQTHIQVDDEARGILREFYRRGSAQQPPSQTSSSAVTPHSSPSQPASPKANPSKAEAVTPIRATGNTAADKITSLATQCQSWQPSRALGTLRDRMVFSTGSAEADLMFIGEAPGYQEERRKEPFVGPAGQKLDQIIKAMGLERSKVYLSNICKFRPEMKNQTTGTRKPSLQEMAACLPFLRAEIDVVKPKVIIALGGTTAECLLNESRAISQMRGNWYQFQGIPLRITYHPSYLLRQNEGVAEKRMVWEDILVAMEKLGLPISDKQRGFFQTA